MSKLAKLIIPFGVVIIVVIGGLIAIFGLPGKSEFNKPVPIRWSKDVCAQCGMLIVDRHHAAEITNPVIGKAYKFDDIGDAVVWAKHNHASDWLKESKIWVTDSKTGKWLNARKAYWVKGQITPMGYGLGALSKLEPGAFKWKEAVSYLLQKRKSLLKMRLNNGTKMQMQMHSNGTKMQDSKAKK